MPRLATHFHVCFALGAALATATALWPVVLAAAVLLVLLGSAWRLIRRLA